MSGRGLRGRGLAAGPPATSQSGAGRGLRKKEPAPQETLPQDAAPAPAPSAGRGRGLARGVTPASATSVGIAATSVASSHESLPSTSTKDAVPQSVVAPSRGLGRSIRGHRRGIAAGRGVPHAEVPSTSVAPTGSGDVQPKAVVPAKPVSLSELQSALGNYTTKVGAHSTRRAHGTKGLPIMLRSNCFAIQLPDVVWHKYDVEIHRGTEKEAMELKDVDKVKNRDRINSRRLNRLILLQVFSTHAVHLGDGYPAYDGRKILIMNHRPFKEDEKYFNVTLMSERNKPMEFTVRLRHTLAVDVSTVTTFYKGATNTLNPEVIQAVNIVIDASFGNSQWVAVNRSYYDPKSPAKPLGGGKEMREGIYTSAMFAEWRSLLIVDKARTAFASPRPLLQFAADVLNIDFARCNGFNPHQLEQLKKEAKGLMVRLEHSGYGRSVKIAGFTSKGAHQITFKDNDGNDCSVADYFRSAYPKFPLKYPHLPCIEVKRANGTKTEYFPIEVCTVKADQPRRKLTPDQTAAMIKHAQERPHERLEFSRRSVHTVINQKEISDFGVRISSEPTMTEGRIIDSPGVQVGRQEVPVMKGSWRLPMFHQAATIHEWAIVDCASIHPEAINKLAQLLRSQAESMRMQVLAPPHILNNRTGWRMPSTTKGMLADLKTQRRNQSKRLLAVIVLGKQSVYSEIKRLTETTPEFRDIVTQCVKCENIMNDKKLGRPFVDNLLKKINVKLGGVNSLVCRRPKRFDEPFMLLGADVSHPGPGDMMTPSIAAIVASMDYAPSKYCTEISVQCSENNNRIEYIVHLRRIVLKLLKEHLNQNENRKPKHIYYLRDGVSDGQFEEVRLREVTAIRNACYDLHPGYQPFVTVLVAQKRHHVRFTVADPRTGTKSGNVPPGTYIDKDVVHPKNHDLYMYTHEGLLGTSRPTHYQVIHSDGEITTDEVTELIYFLTHNYARASRSVSIPSPIYYAHLAAFRAKEHVKADPTLCGSSAASTDSGAALTSAELARYQRACDVDELTKLNLYYA